MPNLLPQAGKRDVHKEYSHRVVAAALDAFAVTCLLSMCYLLPTYFLVHENELSAVYQQNQVLSNQSVPETVPIGNELETIRNLMGVFGSPEKGVAVRSIFTKALNAKPGNVIVTGLYLAGDASNRELKIAGVADTRDALVLYAENLRREKEFTSVDFPVSDLRRESEIEFTITTAGVF